MTRWRAPLRYLPLAQGRIHCWRRDVGRWIVAYWSMGAVHQMEFPTWRAAFDFGCQILGAKRFFDRVRGET